MSKSTSILVLFSKKDNIPPSEEKMGWVDCFKTFLELICYQLKKKKPDILLRDDEFLEETNPQPQKSIDTILIVMSEYLITSEKHLQLFNNIEENNFFTKSSQQFVIVKSKVPYTNYPPTLRHVNKYNMCSVFDKKGGKYIDFFTPKAEKLYWMEMLNLAYDIYKKPTDSNKSLAKNEANHKFIFLAETDEELDIERNVIKHDLERSGCCVLPQLALPTQSVELLEKAVEEDLQKSAFSIHLIGGSITNLTNDTKQSVVAVQNRLAALQNTDNSKANKQLHRLVWIAPNVIKTAVGSDNQQLSFIETIKRGIDINDRLELSEDPFEKFRHMVQEKVITDPQEKHIEEKTGQKKIYLAYDAIDEEVAQPYIDLIKKSNFQVLIDAFKGTFMHIKNQHISNLHAFDAVIIFQQKSTNMWVKMKVLDILKSPGFGRGKPILGKAVLAPNCDISYLDTFKDQNIMLICGDKNRSTKMIEDFISEIKGS